MDSLLNVSKLALVALLFAGCIPIPHDVKVAPALDGVLLHADQPAPQVAIHLGRVSDDGSCYGDPIAHTDDAGQFHNQAIVERRELMLMGDYFPADYLCFEAEGLPAQSWRFGWDAQDGSALECDLFDPDAADAELGEGNELPTADTTPGCRWTLWIAAEG